MKKIIEQELNEKEQELNYYKEELNKLNNKYIQEKQIIEKELKEIRYKK